MLIVSLDVYRSHGEDVGRLLANDLGIQSWRHRHGNQVSRRNEGKLLH